MAAKRLVEPGDGRRGTRQRVRESEVDVEWRGWRGEELVKHHAMPRARADGRKPDSDASKGGAFAILTRKPCPWAVHWEVVLITGLALWRCTPLSDALWCISARVR